MKLSHAKGKIICGRGLLTANDTNAGCVEIGKGRGFPVVPSAISALRGESPNGTSGGGILLEGGKWFEKNTSQLNRGWTRIKNQTVAASRGLESALDPVGHNTEMQNCVPYIALGCSTPGYPEKRGGGGESLIGETSTLFPKKRPNYGLRNL